MTEEYDWQPIKRAARIEQEKFSIGWCESDQSYEIIYNNALFAKIYYDEQPEGFVSRAVEHFFDMLVGRRSALWDEQSIYQSYPRDKAHAQLNGKRMADHLMKQAEQRWQEMDDKRNSIARVTTQEQPAIEAMRTALKEKIDGRLNAYLCDMKPNYDDSITGFNEAWDVVRKTFTE